jgi:hypothetical protein
MDPQNEIAEKIGRKNLLDLLLWHEHIAVRSDFAFRFKLWTEFISFNTNNFEMIGEELRFLVSLSINGK